MEILYVSHCVPWPPDKGDRIRAYYSVNELAKRHDVHVACLARSSEQAATDSELRRRCASVRVEILDSRQALIRGLVRFASGGCCSTAFYWKPALARHIEKTIADRPIRCVVLLSPGMALYAPKTVPFLADWGDVDSEKWMQYSRTRFPGFAYRMEGQRLRRIERECALRAKRAFFTTPNELHLFQTFAPEAQAGCAGNGVDFDYFDPQQPIEIPTGLRDREFLVFVGVLNYFPNSNGVRIFAETIFPELRRRNPKLELFVVGRDPSEEVLRLKSREGITVTGAVDDVRPYLAAARAAVAPLQIARGVQNKVLEALAMGKTVLASDAVCGTFSPEIPAGVMRCESAEDYASAVAGLPSSSQPVISVRDRTCGRFSWEGNLAPMITELEVIERENSLKATRRT